MCTLTIAYRSLADAPIAVAANRDEQYARPSVAPAAIDEGPRVVAPRDEEAGGTWIGYNEAGVFVAVTNRWTDAELTGERSRGLLVRDALSHTDAGAAARAVEAALEAHEYEGFNLAILDAADGILFEWDGTLRVSDLEPGIHVVLNTGYDDRFAIPSDRTDLAEGQVESARMIRETLQPGPDETAAEWLDRAADVLGDHDYNVCFHNDGGGTRSSSLIAIYEDRPASYWFAPGPPCQTAFERVRAD